MFRSNTNLRSIAAALGIAAGGASAFAQVSPLLGERIRSSKGPDLSWAGYRRNKSFGGSVKRHARAAAKARRSKR